MAYILQMLGTGALWVGVIAGFIAGRAYQVFHRARTDRTDAITHVRNRRRQFRQSIPRAIAAAALVIVVTVALVRVIGNRPEILYPDRAPASVPTPTPSEPK